MDKEEIKSAILRRLYDGAFRDDVDYQFNLRSFAEENGIELGLMNRIYDELYDEGFIGNFFAGMVVEPSVKALVYCETQHIADQTLVEKQNEVRKKILETCMIIHEEKLNTYVGGEVVDAICQRANIVRQDFDNNKAILESSGYMERQGPFDIWGITQKGRDIVTDLRKKRRRLAEFNNLKELIGVNRQERGYKLEDLLEEVIAEEGWKTEKRVHQKGVEFDIVFNRDYNYFQVSCKWEKETIEADDLDQLAMRAQEMSCVAAILVSMSGFTEGCIVRTVAKRPIQQVVLFGPVDVESVFQNERRFSDLMDEKIKELKHRSKMLIDGNA